MNSWGWVALGACLKYVAFSQAVGSYDSSLAFGAWVLLFASGLSFGSCCQPTAAQ